MKFIDANVFLFAKLDAGVRGMAAGKVLRGIDAAHPAATNVVALNEVYWNLRKPLGRGAALTTSRDFLRMPGLRTLPLSDREWELAIELMEKVKGLRPNDALHAATALEAGIGTIVSADPDFDEVHNLRRQDLPDG